MPNNAVNTSHWIAVTISESLPKQFSSWPCEHEYLFYFIIFTFILNSSDTSTHQRKMTNNKSSASTKRAKRTSAQKALGKARTNELFRDIATERGAYLSTIQALSEKHNTYVSVGVLSLLLTLPCF